jgi:alpha-L-fucosidase
VFIEVDQKIFLTMKKYKILLIILLFLSARSGMAQDRFQPTWESLKQYQTPDWFRDAKFGIFIHWGVYSVPAFGSEWYPRNMYQKGSKEYLHHIETYGPQTKFGYKDFIPMFKAEKFNADQWASLFAKAGAKYVVPVAEHHDGFAMYKTALSKWNAAEMGPKVDIIGALADACRRKGLIFGVSSHRIEHWWFMGGGKTFESDVRDSAYADFYGPAKVYNPSDHSEKGPGLTTEYMNDWLLRSTELVERYEPQLVWFDWWIEQPAMEPYRKSFASYYYNKGLEWHKGVVLNYKNDAFPKEAAVYDIERGSSKATKDQPWQTDTSIGKKSWGYIDGEENKTPNELIDMLIDIVSKNGNMLLNIGPKADGTVTQEQQDVLLSVGGWLHLNGEGIYGSRPWVVSGEGPTENLDENIKFNEYKFKGYTEKDIRFTTKGDVVYAFVLDIPTERITIKNLSSKAGNGAIRGIELVGSDENVKWKQKSSGLAIEPSKSYHSKFAAAYRISFQK